MSYHTKIPIVRNGLVFVVDANNKKSYVSGDTTTFDLTKNSNDGTLENGVSFSGGSFVFDGINDHIDFGDISSFELDEFTISSWIRLSNDGFNSNVIAMQYQHDSVPGICGVSLQIQPSNVIIGRISIDNSFEDTTSTKTVITDEWIHLVFTKIGTTATLYINGDLEATSTLSNSIVDYSTSGTKTTVIGSKLSSSGFIAPFNGNIEICMTHNRGLSAAEIQQNYNAHKFRFLI